MTREWSDLAADRRGGGGTEKMHLKQIGWEGVEWINLAQNRTINELLLTPY